MITEIITLLKLSDYPFLAYFIGCVIFVYILAATFSLLASILNWVGGKR